MIIPQTVEYAFRAMAQLALSSSKDPISRIILAERTHVPVHFLAKIMRPLVKSKLVKATRGAGGGFVLAKDPQNIRLLDIYEAMGYDLELKHCSFGWSQCNHSMPCPLHHLWSGMRESFRIWLQKNSLSDIRELPEQKIRAGDFRAPLKTTIIPRDL